MMSTPAGASSDMEEVVLSRLSEWPAGDRTAFVPRDSLDGDMNLLTRHQVYRLLDGDPGGGGQHDLVRADDGLPGGGGEERLLGGVRHHEAVRGEGEAAPVCNTRSVSTPGTRTSVTCKPPSSRSVRRFLFLLLMLTEKFPSASSLMGTPGTDDILDN